MADTRVPDLYGDDKKEYDINAQSLEEQISFANYIVKTYDRLVFAGEPYQTMFGTVWQKEIYRTGFILSAMRRIYKDNVQEFTLGLADAHNPNFRQTASITVDKDNHGKLNDFSKNVYQLRNMMEMLAIQVSEEAYDIEHMR